jgi:hypothetical protein
MHAIDAGASLGHHQLFLAVLIAMAVNYNLLPALNIFGTSEKVTQNRMLMIIFLLLAPMS